MLNSLKNRIKNKVKSILDHIKKDAESDSKYRVLLIGDSICLGYRDIVKDLLGPECAVVFPQENACFASYTYRRLYEWNIQLNLRNNFDLVYWNNGLWDADRIFGDENQTSIEGYSRYLKRSRHRLKELSPKAKAIFALTTPVLEERQEKDFYRINSELQEYNAAAMEALETSVDGFDDLYTFAKENLQECYEDAVHFDKKGNELLGRHVAETIRGYLELK